MRTGHWGPRGSFSSSVHNDDENNDDKDDDNSTMTQIGRSRCAVRGFQKSHLWARMSKSAAFYL